MTLCDAKHPERQAYCDRAAGNHEEHSGWDRRDKAVAEWPNAAYVAPRPSGQAAMKALAAQVKAAPVSRASDPPNSRKAEAAYEVKRGTRKGLVAQYLLDNVGEWADAVRFTHPDVGGFAGTRRLRELREEHGWPIETRQKPGAKNTWQHRLAYIPRSDDS